MRTITVINYDDWEGGWLDDELKSEGHHVTYYDLTRIAGDEPFIFRYVQIEGSKAEEEMQNNCGFRGITLDKWLSLAEEPA